MRDIKKYLSIYLSIYLEYSADMKNLSVLSLLVLRWIGINTIYFDYYRDQRWQPRSVRELVQRVGRSIGATASLNSYDCWSHTAGSNSVFDFGGGNMGSRFPQCRGRGSQLQHRYSPYVVAVHLGPPPNLNYWNRKWHHQCKWCHKKHYYRVILNHKA